MGVYTWSWDFPSISQSLGFEGSGSVTERARAQPGRKLSYAASCLVGSQIFEMLPSWLLLDHISSLVMLLCVLLSPQIFVFWDVVLCWLTGLTLSRIAPHCWVGCCLIFWFNQFLLDFPPQRIHFSNLGFFSDWCEKRILSCAKSNGDGLAQGI